LGYGKNHNRLYKIVAKLAEWFLSNRIINRVSYQPIENCGIIGDHNTIALVGLNGSIDFMCFPRFDSPSVFAALLDDKNGAAIVLVQSLRR
jgi:GH15 family glucan-1,4-alpha-glucosidase